jgi:hypothetical protein
MDTSFSILISVPRGYISVSPVLFSSLSLPRQFISCQRFYTMGADLTSEKHNYIFYMTISSEAPVKVGLHTIGDRNRERTSESTIACNEMWVKG